MALVVCMVLAVVGILTTLGCLLAIYLEATGLGAPRDAEMRTGYTALLIAGASAGILLPAVVSILILRPFQRRIALAAALIAVVVALAIIGITTI